MEPQVKTIIFKILVPRPLVEDHEDQVSEDEHEECDLRDELEEDLRVGPLHHLVPQAEEEPERHVEQPEDQGDLHLVRVQEADLVGRALPDRVDPHVVGVALVLREVAGVHHPEF